MFILVRKKNGYLPLFVDISIIKTIDIITNYRTGKYMIEFVTKDNKRYYSIEDFSTKDKANEWLSRNIFNVSKPRFNFKNYQQRAHELAVYPEIGQEWVYPVIGLVSEVGEIADKFKKLYRDGSGDYDNKHFREMIAKELGDCLWYIQEIATVLGLHLDDIAEQNLKKLESRKRRGVLHGDGDDR